MDSMRTDQRPSRLPSLNELEASPEQKKILADILNGPRGNLAGPFLSWIHSPGLAEPAQRLGAFCRYGTKLPLNLSELAILCIAAKWQSQVEWQIHYPIAVQAGLDQSNLEHIRRGDAPNFSRCDEQLIWMVVDELYRTKRISQALYEKAATTFGIEVLVNLVGLLGYYSLVAMTLNVFEVRHDIGGVLPFPE